VHVRDLHVGQAGVRGGEGAVGEDAVDDDGGEVVGPRRGVGEDEGVDLVERAHAVLREEDGRVGGQAVLDLREGAGGGHGLGADDQVRDRWGGRGVFDDFDGEARGFGGVAVGDEFDGGAGLGEGVGQAGTVS